MVWIGIAGIAAVCAALTVYAGLLVYNVAVRRAPKTVYIAKSGGKGGPPPVAGASWGEGQRWIAGRNFTNWELTAPDGLKLRGYWLPSDRAEGRTAIIAHGYSGKAKDMGAYARIYHEVLGFHVLLPDARGHGESGGDYIGFGWQERLDYAGWIWRVLEETGPESEVVLHGVSMGAATVLMAAGEELPPQVKAVVADCAYTSAAAELAYQMRRLYRLPSFPVLDGAGLVTRIRAGYSLREASALRQVAKAKTPILFIHGEADTFVPVGMMEELYAACRSEKERWSVPGAGHGKSYDQDPEAYVRRVCDFVLRHLRGRAQKP
ncbi:alpha/beta hydrolase [Paenibacillus spiritus]|uniref:alpha/beta hydrolase n=1 Tax=Paenibacillus spiritus TaxID=2496557 RepID=UPI001CC68F36|nr:alpha/beta hydrolase [Paenibacillus spiritus]